MNYENAKKVLDEIKEAKKILINCHRGPDPDSIGSALALYLVVKEMGKEVKMICPDEVPSESTFLPFSEKIEKEAYEKFNFSDYDLLILLDSSSWEMASGRENLSMPKINSIVIDHHMSNKGYGRLNIIDRNISSNAEMLFYLFEDWEVSINKDIAQCLLTGIIADTGAFEYPEVTAKTFTAVQKLMEAGADKNEIIFYIYRNIEFEQVKFWGEVIRRMEIDTVHKFVWSAIPYDVFVEFGKPLSGKETAASLFCQTISGTDFGMVMVEKEKNVLAVSFRGRTNFDVSKVAEILGGGGHKTAAGVIIRGLDFSQAVQKVIETARKVANERKI